MMLLLRHTFTFNIDLGMAMISDGVGMLVQNLNSFRLVVLEIWAKPFEKPKTEIFLLSKPVALWLCVLIIMFIAMGSVNCEFPLVNSCQHLH